MKIVVCIKQVPAVPDMKIDPATHTLVREGVPSILNPWDKIGVEEGIRLREKYGGEVTVITMGPPQAKEAVLECLAMGADKGIILSDSTFAGADTIATAYTLSMQIKKMIYDIIICGRLAMDAETGHVGPHLAELLGIPQICYVKRVDVDIDRERVIAHREVEEGVEIVEAPLPVLLTVMKGLNEPRLPTLKGVIGSRRKEIRVINSSELGGDMSKYGLKGSPTSMKKVFPPPLRKPKMILQGDPKEVVESLVQVLLREK
ncbi:MAG: electron transfer flavoprotein subunit beta/FixA family protein [archaeon]|nr:electron transfer flavoprotein subunit beta/FixA family protein [archaeon]MCP8306081.1 electron transfer flavoprotein subunit beta/FixA family protein [archaeon]